MPYTLNDRVWRGEMTRRDFLWLATAGTGAVALGGLSGCAVDPVTGEKTLVLMSEAQEVQLDRERSPHQFSSDYGAVQDQGLNAYLDGLGRDLAGVSHRPGMPYSFRAVNATYVNAYAFPGGSVAVTRGILLEMDNEAEAAGLLGHEIGHVNARHAAERAAKSLLAQLAVVGATAYASTTDEGRYAPLVQSLGGVGAGALLAHYSRDDEREADALGMEYMARAGHNPEGMVGLMDILRRQSRHKPSTIETMFSTHPMSDERYATARRRADEGFAAHARRPLNRERYLDHTAALRRLRPAVEAMQQGERQMGKEDYRGAEGHFETALAKAPEDYAGLVMMAKCQVAMDRPGAARRYAERARAIYPDEAQASNVAGISALMEKDYDAALSHLRGYERRLPGNPNTLFLQGVALEGKHNRRGAAEVYARYLAQVRSGAGARHAAQRLADWGYLKPAPGQ